MQKSDKSSSHSNTLIYGHHPVVEAITSGRAVEKVFFQQGLRGDIEKEIRQLTRHADIPLAVVPKPKLDKLTRHAQHQGVAAWMASVDFYRLEDVLPVIFERGEVPLLLLLDGITDVRNFGAICRSALVGGVHAVVVPAAGTAPANEDAMKASAGALAHLTLCREKSLVAAVDVLKSSGVQVVATVLHGNAQHIFNINFKLPTAIILGAEDTGVQPKLLHMADAWATIPQAGNFDSLNVSVAAGIAVYEALRQRLFLHI